MEDPSFDPEQRQAKEVRLVACSVRGPSHEENGVPCQDSWYGHRLSGIRFVLTVGDGLGSASRSSEGSKIATRKTANSLKDHLVTGGSTSRDELRLELEEAFSSARNALVKRSEMIGQSVSSFNTTLLAIVGSSQGVAAGAVGDGGIVRRFDGEHHLMVPPEDTEYANRTTPITSNHWKDSFRFGYHEDVDAAAVFSDGVDPFAWDLDEPSEPRDEFFDRIFSYIESVQETDKARQGLRDFLDDDHFRDYSGDDKTIGIVTLPDDSISTRLAHGQTIGRSLFEQISK